VARSRKSVPRGTRKRVKRDWVYRGPEESADGRQYDLATYAPGLFRAMDDEQSVGHVLYDSQNYMLDDVSDTERVLNRAARAEGRRAQTFMVDGWMSVQASTWSLGDEIGLGMRIGVFDQDSAEGNIQVDAAYTMWENGSFINDTPSVYANQQRSNLWTNYFVLHFATGNEQSLRLLRIRARARAYLNSGECLGLYMQCRLGTVALRYWLALRTLVADEG